MTFTVDDVLAAMREAVKEKGEDYIYPSRHGECHYTQPDGVGGVQASCLVGDVINRLDPSALRLLRKADRTYAGVPAYKLIENGYLAEDFWTLAAGEVAADAQRLQDRGRPWGEALASAESIADQIRKSS